MVIDDGASLSTSPLVVAEGSTLPASAVVQGIAQRSRALWLLPSEDFHERPATTSFPSVERGHEGSAMRCVTPPGPSEQPPSSVASRQMPMSCGSGSLTETSRGAGGHDRSGDMNSTSGCESSSHRPRRSWRPRTRSRSRRRVPEWPEIAAEQLVPGWIGQVASSPERDLSTVTCSVWARQIARRRVTRTAVESARPALASRQRARRMS